jgi:multidrug efflux pump
MFSSFFIDRPIFAAVLSIVIVILGGVAYPKLPISQYPEVAPPVVQVSAIYPGANAKTVAETVATPIELEVNGVERMLYMSSRCTNDGQMYLDVTFEVGTDLDMAQVLVQNRVSIAEAKLPEEVKRQGVTTKKKSPAILLCVNLISPDASYDQLHLSNFALMNIKDDLARIKGVGDVAFLGPRDYSMRVWLDPNKLADRGMTVGEVVKAVKEQNIQVAAGRIGQSPVPEGANVPFQLTINTQGRMESAGEFGTVIVKTGDRGQNVYLKDVVRDTEFAMHVKLDPKKLADRGMTADSAAKSIRKENAQVAAVRIEGPPIPENGNLPIQLAIITQGRIENAAEFRKLIVEKGDRDQVVYLKDVLPDATFVPESLEYASGVELGAKSYDVNSYLDGKPAVTLAVFQLPGSNALKTAAAVKAKMEELKENFPAGINYEVYYDTTVFVSESIHEVFKTLIEAFILVFLVVLVFLQDWRATIIPMIAVPVSLIGTFALMAMMGFSLNNLSLFGLVLAIGIVVDDAIVVVENVERYLAMGHPAGEAARLAMAEVSGPVVAIALVLCAVFVPTAFMAGISGEFFRQFALTIAASTIISAFNSLTLSPALCAILFKGHGTGHEAGAQGHAEKVALPRTGVVLIAGALAYFMLTPLLAHLLGVQLPGGHGEHSPDGQASSAAIRGLQLISIAAGVAVGWFLAGTLNRALGAFFAGFNWAFERVIEAYGRGVALFLRISVIALLVYGGLMGLTLLGFKAVPSGFIPDQDKGYLVINAQLPDGASLDRTDKIVRQMSAIARDAEKVPGVWHTIDLPGYSALLGTNISNVGGMFVILEPFEERKGDPQKSAAAIAAKLREQYAEIRGGRITVFGAPAIDGLGTTGGFKLQVQDRSAAGLRALQGAVRNLGDEGNADPRLVGLFSSFTVNQPQLFVEIDRDKAKAQKVSLDDVNQTLQAYLGGLYVNDVTLFNRNWQVNVQADARFRMRVEDIGRLEVRNSEGQRVPLRTLVDVKDDSGPAIVNHYNSYPSAELNGNMAPGTSSGQAVNIMDQLSNESLPSSMKADWTEITLQQIIASDFARNLSEGALPPALAFPLAVVFVFLVLSAQYESWSLPLSIILIVPMCLLASIAGIWLVKMDNNIFTQIGLVVLIGLAAKNAILIVEFAKQKQDQGASRLDATVDACRLRLRPILMTSFAFILGVLPLVLAKGPGAEMRVALGVAVFSGMLGVTIFGLFFTPVFYAIIMRFGDKRQPADDQSVKSHENGHA